MHASSKIVVGVAGRIGSGKTAVARHIERDFGFQYLRYSQVLADWLQEDPSDKVRLQLVGGAVMAGTGQHELNSRLISMVDRSRDVGSAIQSTTQASAKRFISSFR
jgi:Ni2+-binding GTPase involved in maturation of urease and hydrogenase